MKIGPHLFIKTPAPALVICCFGLILFLIVARLVEDKIKLSKLNDTVSKQSSELAELQRKTEQRRESEQREDGIERREREKVHAKLESPKEELQMPRSEMGTFIARNHDEIDQLRRMGERDYVEFTIEDGKAQILYTYVSAAGTLVNVTVELKSINAKRDHFTIEVQYGDNSFEKKNRSVNEPIFFYATGSRAPEELVVNKLTKNQASGYLSVPKPPLHRRIRFRLPQDRKTHLRLACPCSLPRLRKHRPGCHAGVHPDSRL